MRGNPDKRHISISFAERQNHAMRMAMRRFTRVTNGFSKKNVARVHKTQRVTPAMEAGFANHVWSIEESSASCTKEHNKTA